LGILLGLIFVLVGAVFRIDLLGLAGALLFFLALFIDKLGIGSSTGIGPRQQIVMGIAILLLLCGLILRRRSRGHHD
ncbi:MAG TPA: hypothetical protein VMV81_02060, partial [Phycisphaerae bacterium]|nr:hypothetical protein [Phycisphaerae bacterium]